MWLHTKQKKQNHLLQAKSDALDRYYQTLRTYFHVVLKTKRVIHEMREKYIDRIHLKDLQSKSILKKKCMGAMAVYRCCH